MADWISKKLKVVTSSTARRKGDSTSSPPESMGVAVSVALGVLDTNDVKDSSPSESMGVGVSVALGLLDANDVKDSSPPESMGVGVSVALGMLDANDVKDSSPPGSLGVGVSVGVLDTKDAQNPSPSKYPVPLLVVRNGELF